MTLFSNRLVQGIIGAAMLGLVGVVLALAFGGLSDRAPDGFGVDRDADMFKDCPDCPEMLAVEPGTVTMGSDLWLKSKELDYDARDQHTVTIETAFAMARHEVTFANWDACVSAGGCNGYAPPDEGWGRGPLPVIHVSWNDATAYAAWLTETTGHLYRLPSEAEWEYAARGGSTLAFPWGRFASHEYANFGEKQCCTGKTKQADQWVNTAPVGHFPPNGFGLHDTAGNVYEWVQDCFRDRYSGAPVDGSADLSGDCERRRIRGGAWYSDPGRIRSSYRAWQTPDQRDYVIGFRVVRELP